MQRKLTYDMLGRSTLDITRDIDDIVRMADVDVGVCHVFCMHTSASLMICENIDPAVRDDVERWMQKTVVDGDPMFLHDMEGPDDMSGHIRTMLTGVSLNVPVAEARLQLGTYQGIYLYEHRTASHRRQVMVTVLGAASGC
ncbi:secondary thiamine-phosphate synthase enzyme YjbQ [Salinisphaera aquimarina]|uniref:Secondary thiamine-phosphate synthase enzyme YjbQ n=1 Tax=Salinisphaera aquimarina TaxID=2094031 RepID=A0ABV7EJN9_9GAMM